MSDRLVIFSRYPLPGRAKTRLIPALGPEGAALLQRQMTRHVLQRAASAVPGGAVEVRFEGGGAEPMASLFGRHLRYRPQGPGDLGRRLLGTFRDAEAEGIGRTVIVGSDIPGLKGDHVRRALGELDSSDVVLGPAADGGYYLIGLKRPAAGLFEQIPWGGDGVLEATLAAARCEGLRVALLETLPDVDRPEDLVHWRRALADGTSRSGDRLSVVIPTRAEADELPATLEPLRRAERIEVLVVDSGSEDDTVAIARRWGATVLTGVRGRARQMNAGALVAEGGNLLFLHADTLLPDRFDHTIRHALDGVGVAAGAFRLKIREAAGSLKLIEVGANLRARLARMPYGDQAIFLRAELFHRLGGFPDLPIMEDFVFVRTLRRQGRIAIADQAVVTSNRRWRRLGPWRATLINQLVVLGYHLGFSCHRLARLYRRG